MKNRPNTVNRFRLSALALATAMVLVPAQAGFLDDFYTQSGSTVNMTAGGVYEGQSSNVLSGGGFNYRVPNRTFNAFTLTPPSVKSGCGGIDLYLGAFGFPTQGEMTAFLRNVGQSAGGIAFSIALKALSPELDSTINDFSKRIQSMVQQFKSSCQAAQTLMDSSGANAFIFEAATNAKKALRTSSSDETEAERKAADPVALKQNASAFASANPNSGLNPERNIVWDALHSGDFGGTLTDQEMRYVMAITGSIITKFTSTTDESSPTFEVLKPSTGDVDKLIENLIGDKSTATVDVDVYSCTNKNTDAPANYSSMPNNCLIASVTTETIGGGFRYRLEQSKEAVVQAIRTRSSLNTTSLNHYAILQGASVLPLLKIVQASAQQRNNFIGDAAVSQYLDIAAREMAIKYLRSAIGIIRLTLNTSGSSIATTQGIKDIQIQIAEVSKRLDATETNMRQQISNLAETLQMYENVRKYMQSSMSADMSRTRGFGG